jgi:hypothetical protein
MIHAIPNTRRGAHRTGREQQRIDVPDPAQRAGLPSGGADQERHDGADAPEQRVAHAGIADDSADLAVHRQMHGQYDPEEYRQRVYIRSHRRSLSVREIHAFVEPVVVQPCGGSEETDDLHFLASVLWSMCTAP